MLDNHTIGNYGGIFKQSIEQVFSVVAKEGEVIQANLDRGYQIK
jgi:hypothetical protein